MNIRLLTGAFLVSTALLTAQPEQKKAPEDTRPAVAGEAAKEAQRQGQVALKPNATQSPSQTMQQAIAFERFKEQAAERQAQKEAGGTSESSTASAKSPSKVRHTAALARPKR